MKKNVTRGYIVLAILAIVFAVVAFAVPFNRSGVFYLAVVFAFIAIAAQIYVFSVAFKRKDTVKSKFYGIPIANVGVVYLIVQIVLSLAFMALSTIIRPWIVIVVFAVLLGVAAVGFIAADIMRDEIERQDATLKVKVETMRSLQSKVAALPALAECDGLKGELSALSDAFRYSDPVSSAELESIENDLLASVDELQRTVLENDTEAAHTLIASITATLSERNRLCKLGKGK